MKQSVGCVYNLLYVQYPVNMSVQFVQNFALKIAMTSEEKTDMNYIPIIPQEALAFGASSRLSPPLPLKKRKKRKELWLKKRGTR